MVPCGMLARVLLPIVFLLLLAMARPAPAQDRPNPLADVEGDSTRLFYFANAIHGYAQKNDGRIPPDFAAVVTYFAKDGESAADVIRARFLAPGVAAPEVPRDANAAWAN